MAREDVADFTVHAVADAGTLHDYAARAADARAMRGRGSTWAMSTPGGAWAVRHFRRGGAVAKTLGDRYLRPGTARPFAELIVSEAARARGIATPQVMAAVAYADGIFYRGDIATQLIPDASDLDVLTFGELAWSTEDRVLAWRAAGALLHMCFHCGLIHADLNIRNIIVHHGTPGVVAHVIDLDRARLTRSLAASEREQMLTRFHRSLAKVERERGASLDAASRRAFQEGVNA